MENILVTYDSGYGSTEVAAKIIAETLTKEGFRVDLRIVGQEDPSGYDVLLVGSPIRLGRCTPRIKRFLKKHSGTLERMQVAFFFTCMSITDDKSERDLPLFVDPSFNNPDRPRARISMMENNHNVEYYLKHFLKHMPGIAPIKVSFFKGRLDTAKLSPLHRLIMRIAMYTLPEIQNGDFLDPTVIQAWAESLANRMQRS